MKSLDRFATEKLEELAGRQLRRTLVDTDRAEAPWTIRAGRRLLSFSCNDYLGLATHPEVKQAAIEAIRHHGAGAGASRLVTGNHPLLSQLEAKLAKLKGTEDACIFGSGYLANAGIIPALVDAGDLVLADKLSHSCIWTGAKLSDAKVLRFRHNDMAHLEELLAANRNNHKRCLIATEGVFSMDGDLAPLPELSDLARRFDAWLLTDDAHALGVVGGGHGSAFAHGGTVDVPLQMGTLSKAAGGYGAYLCASRPVIDLIKNRARTVVYTTGLPPASAAGALAAIDIIERQPELAGQVVAKARLFGARAGLPEPASAIVPVIVGSAQAALDAAALLAEHGFLVVPIRPPTVPEGTARLRIAFTAAHPDAEIERLADLVREQILAPSRLRAAG